MNTENLTDQEQDLLAKARAADVIPHGPYRQWWEYNRAATPAAIIDLLTQLAAARATPPREFSFEQLHGWVYEAVCAGGKEVPNPIDRGFLCNAIFRHLRECICKSTAQSPAADLPRTEVLRRAAANCLRLTGREVIGEDPATGEGAKA